MIEALIAGQLFRKPQSMISKAGKPFAGAKLTVLDNVGQSIFVDLIAFEQHAISQLLSLTEGDSVAVCGALTPKVYEDKWGQQRPALGVLVKQVLTVYLIRNGAMLADRK